MVVDAGGGTVDLAVYRMDVSENVFEEIAASECRSPSLIILRHPDMNGVL